MFKRPFFLLGLLLGALAGFRLRLSPRPQPVTLVDPDFFTDALLVCDSAGAVAEANAAARTLFGACRLPLLRYPTGQAVPPGQHPLHRAASMRETAAQGSYRCTAADGSEHLLDVITRPLPGGRTAAIFRDVTVQHAREAQEQAASARQVVVRSLCSRLSAAQTAEEIALAVAEETYALLRDFPKAQVRLFLFDPASDTLTCLASAPDDRPKRPLSAAAARLRTARFDVQVPELWQMYVARKTSATGLPLVSNGIALGHLTVTSPAANLLEEMALRESLELIASLAALALAGPAAAARAAADAAQMAAMRGIVSAAGSGGTRNELADFVCACVKRVTQAEVCLLSLPVDGKLRVMGQAYQDDLLFPGTAPDHPQLHGKAVQKAWRTQKMTAQIGITNLAIDAGPWRMFAGGTESYSVIALPLTNKRGVLTLYTRGSKPLPDTHLKFLQTAAALLALSPATATAPEDGASS